MLNNNKKQETLFFGTKCGNANSIAAGYATETTNYGEIATGILNKSTKGDNPNSPEGVVGDPKATLFSVGCGTKEERKNALEVKGDGSVIISGKDGSDVNIADLAEKMKEPSVDLSEYVKSNDIYQCIKKDYDSSKRGENAIAIDDSAKAISSYSTALGYEAQATNSGAIALGAMAKATGGCASSLGGEAQATGDFASAFACGANATGNFAISLGYEAQATGNYSISLGASSKTTDYGSIALGGSAEAIGSYIVVLGYEAQATGDNSIAIGLGAETNSGSSIALGASTQANGSNAIALGDSAKANTIAGTALGVIAQANGNFSTALGYNAQSNGTNSTALGSDAKTNGGSATALGSNSKATGNFSTALGGSAKATGHLSTALGYNAQSTGDFSIALGYNTKTSTISKYALGGYDENKEDIFNIEEIIYSQYGNKKYLIGLGGYDGTNLTVTNNDVETLNPDIKSVQEIINGKVDLTPIITSTDATISLQPNKKYEITAGDTLVLTFIEPSDKTYKNEYLFSINTGSSVSTITFPTDIIWDVEPVISANKHYEINVQYSQGKYWGTVRTWNMPS